MADLRGARVQMHSPLTASNVFLRTYLHESIIQQCHAATTTRHNYTLTYQFLTDLQMFV